MKGNNTLILNQATVAEAIEEYLNKRALAPSFCTVKNVQQYDDNALNFQGMFAVDVMPRGEPT